MLRVLYPKRGNLGNKQCNLWRDTKSNKVYGTTRVHPTSLWSSITVADTKNVTIALEGLKNIRKVCLEVL